MWVLFFITLGIRVVPLASAAPLSAAAFPEALSSELASAIAEVRQMIALAMTDGGVQHEEAILAAKQRLEALYVKSRPRLGARKHARQLNAQGLQHLQAGQIAEAIQALQAAHQADPADVEITDNLGYAYLRQGNLAEAEQILLQALALAPGRSSAWATLGQVYARQENLPSAVACFANAYRFSRNRDTTRQLLERLTAEVDAHVSTAAQHALQLSLVRGHTELEAVAEKPEAVIQAFYKAANAGKYAEAKQYLSSENLRYIEYETEEDPLGRRGGWPGILDAYTKSQTLQSLEVSEVSMEGDAATCKISLRFTDGNTRSLKSDFAMEGNRWKIAWIGTLIAEQAFEEYRVRIYGDPEASLRLGWWRKASLEILQGGHRVYTAQSSSFRVGHLYEDEQGDALIAMGRDITGNGLPNLTVSEFTGGAHCCTIVHIFEIGPQFRKIAELDAGHSDLAYFADLDGDGFPELVLNDWTFAYWRTSFSDSPAPTVILRYRDGAYRVAPELMRKPAPSRTELETRAQQVRNEEWWQKVGKPPSEAWIEQPEVPTPSALWGTMLELLYTGHAELARQFFEMAWPPDVPGKDEFLKDFRDQLAQSPFWPLDSGKALK